LNEFQFIYDIFIDALLSIDAFNLSLNSNNKKTEKSNSLELGEFDKTVRIIAVLKATIQNNLK
jgi:hypothetical protein